MKCHWCWLNSGCTHAWRDCCKLRRLALSPRANQAAHAATLTQAQRDELRPLLAAEIKRLKGLK